MLFEPKSLKSRYFGFAILAFNCNMTRSFSILQNSTCFKPVFLALLVFIWLYLELSSSTTYFSRWKATRSSTLDGHCRLMHWWRFVACWLWSYHRWNLLTNSRLTIVIKQVRLLMFFGRRLPQYFNDYNVYKGDWPGLKFSSITKCKQMINLLSY